MVEMVDMRVSLPNACAACGDSQCRRNQLAQHNCQGHHKSCTLGGHGRRSTVHTQ